MVNKVILVGNVGADPEVRYLQEDVPVARLSVATSESYKKPDGERITNTEWHNVTLWRGLAKVAEQWVKKGQMVYIEGKLQYRSYEKDGVTRYTTDIVASEMKMLGKNTPSDGMNQNGGGFSQPQANPSQPASDNSNNSGIDLTPDDTDDLPF